MAYPGEQPEITFGDFGLLTGYSECGQYQHLKNWGTLMLGALQSNVLYNYVTITRVGQ